MKTLYESSDPGRNLSRNHGQESIWIDKGVEVMKLDSGSQGRVVPMARRSERSTRPAADLSRPRRRLARARAAGLLLLALTPAAGCTREFFREWANQDVSEAVFEKSRDPRWRLDLFSVEPPPLARYA